MRLCLQGPAFTYEVIIVDDGSKDHTARVAMGYVKQHGVDAVRVLRMPFNSGKGRAVREGMLIARGELCLMMDADGATRVSDMQLLESAIKVTTHKHTYTQRARSPMSAGLYAQSSAQMHHPDVWTRCSWPSVLQTAT